MALNSALIMKFHSSLLGFKPKTFVAPPLNHYVSISKPYKTTNFVPSINAKTSSLEPMIRNLRNTVVVILFATSMFGKFQTISARAENHPILTVETTSQDDKTIETLNQLMDQKFESGDYDESLRISKELVSAQPEYPPWKIAMAKILKETGETKKAIGVLDEILSENPLQLHALFMNAVWMGLNGLEEEAIKKLEKALKIAKEKNNATVIRDVKLIIAQVKFLQKKVDDALKSFDELEKEDPKDCRIIFCKGLLFYCTDRNAEATEQFDKYFELLPNAIQGGEGFMTTLPRMRPPGI